MIETNYAHSKIELSGGYIRYFPLNPNWTGESKGGYTGRGASGFTFVANGFNVSVAYILHKRYRCGLEMFYWRQRLEELRGCCGLPNHNLSILPITLSCRITILESKFNPYFDIGAGIYFQHLSSVNSNERYSGIVGGVHSGLGLAYYINSLLYLDLGGRIFFTEKTSEWINTKVYPIVKTKKRGI